MEKQQKQPPAENKNGEQGDRNGARPPEAGRRRRGPYGPIRPNRGKRDRGSGEAP
ncbi:MAG TPA: hypothetical protein VJU83_07905 [Burkholderiales bacterium]|nr:hypothetical protein [Burkholderiales bacterium]